MEQLKLTRYVLLKHHALPWPPVGHEEHPWAPDLGASDEADARQGSFLATVTPRIANVKLPHLGTAVRRLERVTNDIVRFDTYTAQRGRPFLATLIWAEGVCSSRIARVYSSVERIWLAEVGRSSWREGVLVGANVRATRRAVELAGDKLALGAEDVHDLHQVLLKATQAKGWRQRQTWDADPYRMAHLDGNQTEFVPPHPGRVPAAMADLEEFMRRKDLPALVQMAIAHAQFLTISPFMAGNGRVARALTQAHLRAARLTESSVLPLSSGLLRHRYDRGPTLEAYREGDVGPLLEMFAEAASTAVVRARELQADLDDLMATWNERIGHVRQGAAARRMLEILAEQPMFRATRMARLLSTTKVPVYMAAAQLVDRGILEVENPATRRNSIWVAPEALRLQSRLGRDEP